MKIGLYGIGLDTYWAQFEGLYDRLQGYQRGIAERLEASDTALDVINTGVVDNPEKAREVGDHLAREGVELILLYVSTYALSSTVLPVVQRAKVPVLVLNLQPVRAIDYESFNALGDRGKMTGEWLAHCQACSAPEIACVFNRAGIEYHLVTGTLDDAEAWTEILDWVAAAKVARALRNARVGVLGHYYCGMLDVYSDMTQLAVDFGVHFELLEMCELHRHREEAGADSHPGEAPAVPTGFRVEPACIEAELDRAAQTSVALDALVAANRLDAMAYYYEGQPGNAYENIVTSVIAGQHPADHARRARGGRMRDQERRRHENHGPLRYRRELLRVLRHGFRRRHRVARPRRPGPPGHRRGARRAGAPAGLPRQAGHGPVHPDDREARPRHTCCPSCRAGRAPRACSSPRARACRGRCCRLAIRTAATGSASARRLS